MDRDCQTQGLPREVRLRHRREFQTLWSKGRRIHTPHFIVLLMESTDPSVARLGLTVSRKVGNAVVRNRIKRCIRECFRQQRQRLNPFDVSVVAKAGAGILDSASVCNELSLVFLRITRRG